MDDKSLALDQMMALEDDEWEFIQQKVEDVAAAALAKGDPEDALAWGYGLRRGGHVRGLALAHLLYELHSHWMEFQTDDTFEDAVLKSVGIADETCRKYLAVWRWLFSDESRLSGTTQKRLAGKPISTLDLLPAAARDDRFGPDEWQRIANAHDQTSVRDIVRETRGKATSSESALYIMLDRDGTLKHRRGSQPYKECGSILRDGDEDTEEMIERFQRVGLVVR